MQTLELDTPDIPIQNATQGSSRPYLGANSDVLSAAALLSVVLLGLAVRTYGLTSYDIWSDEAYHIQLVKLPTVGAMLEAVLANPPSDPLYVLLLRSWASLFGHGDLAVRALSVILSTATILATYWLGKVVAGRAAGLVGALLLALSPYAVEFGQQASLYVLASLTTTLALAAGLRWSNTGYRRDAVLYVALGIVAIYSHYVVAAMLGLFGLLALYRGVGRRPAGRRGWIVAHATIFMAWTPWLVAMTVSWLNTPLSRAALRNPTTLDQVLGALVQYSSGTAALLQKARAPEVLGLLAGSLLLIAGWTAGREAGKHGLRLIIVMNGLVFLLPAIVSTVTGLWLFVPHFMVFLLPAGFVVLGAGLVYLAAWSGRASGAVPSSRLRYPSLALASVWLVAQLWGLALFYRYPPHGADGLREIATILNAKTQPDDLVLVVPPLLQPSLSQYYTRKTRGLPGDFDLYNLYPPYNPAQWYSDSLREFRDRTRGTALFWLVYRPEMDEKGRLLAEINRRYTEAARYEQPFATLYLFEAR